MDNIDELKDITESLRRAAARITKGAYEDQEWETKSGLETLLDQIQRLRQLTSDTAQ